MWKDFSVSFIIHYNCAVGFVISTTSTLFSCILKSRRNFRNSFCRLFRQRGLRCVFPSLSTRSFQKSLAAAFKEYFKGVLVYFSWVLVVLHLFLFGACHEMLIYGVLSRSFIIRHNRAVGFVISTSTWFLRNLKSKRKLRQEFL